MRLGKKDLLSLIRFFEMHTGRNHTPENGQKDLDRVVALFNLMNAEGRSQETLKKAKELFLRHHKSTWWTVAEFFEYVEEAEGYQKPKYNPEDDLKPLEGPKEKTDGDNDE